MSNKRNRNNFIEMNGFIEQMFCFTKEKYRNNTGLGVSQLPNTNYIIEEKNMHRGWYIWTLFLVIFVFSCGCLGGCTEQKKTGEEEEITVNVKNGEKLEGLNTDYHEYSGIWSEKGLNRKEVIESGGIDFEVKISNGNEIEGTLFFQQVASERIVYIENITGIVEEGQCYYEFADDGWGNSGTLHIIFKENEIMIEVENVTSENEDAGNYTFAGAFLLIRVQENRKEIDEENTLNIPTTQTEKSAEYYYDYTEEEIIKEIETRKSYLDNCVFYNEVLQYMEGRRGVTDISVVIEPLFNTDDIYYTEEDFSNELPLIIYLAKNEIYARHGYIFEDKDLNNYFNGQLWYFPSQGKNGFDESVFSDIEVENLKLLVKLDTYKIENSNGE